jgi:hypothetical protein
MAEVQLVRESPLQKTRLLPHPAAQILVAVVVELPRITIPTLS